MKERIPGFQTMMLPFLQAVADGQPHITRDIHDTLCTVFELTEAEIAEMLPRGTQTKMRNRVSWTSIYLRRAGVISAPQRGVVQITDAGRQLLATKPERIDVKLLKSLPAFAEWYKTASSRDADDSITDGSDIEASRTPEELLDDAYNTLREELALELLEKVKACSPAFFENLVVELLLKMGYGGSRKEAGQVMGRSGDGGIDGLIKEDKLGLDTIYLQAKRWEAAVTIHQVRDFAGSLLSQKAKKGIFLTTSTFPASAHEFVKSIEPKIVLIGGAELASLMIDYSVGVSTRKTYDIKKLDLDYFEEV